MTREKYGEPDSGDPTSAFERQISDVAEKEARFMEEEAAKVINRPIGSRRVSEAEQMEDYLTVRNDPDALGRYIEGLKAQLGENAGWWAALDYVEKMEKRYNGDFRGEVPEEVI